MIRSSFLTIIFGLLMSSSLCQAQTADLASVLKQNDFCGRIMLAGKAPFEDEELRATLADAFSKKYPVFYSTGFYATILRQFELNMGVVNDLKGGKLIRDKMRHLRNNRELVLNDHDLSWLGERVFQQMLDEFSQQSAKKIAKKYSLKDTDFEELKHLIMSIYGDPRLQVQMNLLLADTIYYSLSDLMVYSQREGVFRNEYILKFPAAAPGPMKLPVILGVGTLVAFYPRTYCYLAFCGRYSFLHTTKAKSALKKATQGVKAIDLDKMGTAIARHDQQSAFNIAVINSKLGRVPEAASLDRFETLLNYDEEFFNALHDLDLWGVAQNDRFTQPATWKTFSEQLLSSDRVFAAGQLKNVRLHLAAYRDTVTEQQNSLTQAQETLQAMDLQVMAKLEREIPAIPALIQKELQNIQTRILKKTHEMSIELESLEEWRKRCSDGIVTIDEFERNIESGAQANSELLPYLRTLKTELTIPEFLKGLQ